MAPLYSFVQIFSIKNLAISKLPWNSSRWNGAVPFDEVRLHHFASCQRTISLASNISRTLWRKSGAQTNVSLWSSHSTRSAGPSRESLNTFSRSTKWFECVVDWMHYPFHIPFHFCITLCYRSQIGHEEGVKALQTRKMGSFSHHLHWFMFWKGQSLASLNWIYYRSWKGPASPTAKTS